MTKGKIIFCVTNDLSTDQRMIRICTSLAKSGFEIELVGRKLKDSVPLLSKDYKQTRLNVFFTKGPLFYLEFNIRLFLFLLINKFQIVCANDPDTLAACGLAKIIKGKKGVYDSHEYFTETPELSKRMFKKRIWSFVENFFGRKMDAHYTVGFELARILSAKLNRHFEVVRNIPTANDNNIINQPKDKILIYQGVLNVGRGIEEAIQAMKFLPDYELWIVGDGDIAASLKDSVPKDIQDRIKFWGKVSPDRLHAITSQARYGLNLLDGDSKNYYYSLANKFFEYMHAGIPSINIDFPEYRAILEKHKVGITIPKMSVNDLVEAVKRLDRDHDLTESIINNISIYKSLYTWEEEEKKLINIYRKLTK